MARLRTLMGILLWSGCKTNKYKVGVTSQKPEPIHSNRIHDDFERGVQYSEVSLHHVPHDQESGFTRS